MVGKRLGILVADDDRNVATTLLHVLAHHGFDAWMVNDSSHVVREAEHRKPDLIILDYDMPNLLGSEVSILLRNGSQTKDIPIIFLSGMTDEDTRTIISASGAASLLAKPFIEAELIQAIRRLTQKPRT